MNKLLAIIGAAVAIILGSFVIRDKDAKHVNTPLSTPVAEAPVNSVVPASNTTPTPIVPVTFPSTQTATTEHIVRYTDNGYIPSTIEITVGETVIFKNESSEEVWTASDPHPVHSILPEFDERVSSAPSTEYQHVFAKKGTWKFHNHRNPTKRGSVIVK